MKNKCVIFCILSLLVFANTGRADFLYPDYTLEGFIKTVEYKDTSIHTKSLRLQAEAHLRGIYFGYRNERLSNYRELCVLPESVNSSALIAELLEAVAQDSNTYYPKMSLTQALRNILFKKCKVDKKLNNEG